jgi:adsorption protein B
MGADDFIWDIVSLAHRRSYMKQLIDLHLLDRQPPRLLAVIVAAWHEENVIGDVIENMFESVNYPRSMYHIFLGVYPNDDATVAVARELAEKHANVHVIINELPGPTSKAQNINYVIRQIKEFENKHKWCFAALTIHDSEDVVHPYEFKVTNYLLKKYSAIQFPVFPLMQMPRFGNFFKNITTGTYADEFAENHFTTMVGRYSSGAFVPSAGTGFVVSRATLELFEGGDVFPRDSLTEDYRLSLTLFEKGVQVYYVLERAPRIVQDNKLKWEFIATRSMFPKTFPTAVRQKTRWILGITMQSFKFREILEAKNMRLVGRYSLYRDLKAKVGNLIFLLGYPVLVYFILSLFFPLETIYPMYSLSWYLSVMVTGMMIERQLFRGTAIYNVYGMRSVFFACLLPPLIPIRLVWGNIINLTSTLRAYKQRIFGNQTPAKKEKKAAEKTEAPSNKKLTWSKTDHQFLGQRALKRYRRKLGDVLLEKAFVSAEDLQRALREAARKKQTIGRRLIEKGLLSEEQLLEALANVKHIVYVETAHLNDYALGQYASDFDEQLLRRLLCIPLLKTEDGFVIAFCDDSHPKAQTALRETYGIAVHAVFASRQSVEKGLLTMYGGVPAAPPPKSPAMKLFEKHIINYEQLILVRSYAHKIEKSEDEVLDRMGLSGKEPPKEMENDQNTRRFRYAPRGH